MIGRDVIYKGRVQGVGFRWTTNDLAKTYNVVGTVENREDGTVFLSVEGNLQEVEVFMNAIAGRMAGNIKDIIIHERVSIGAYNGFHVLY